jgi:hypothetical protein
LRGQLLGFRGQLPIFLSRFQERLQPGILLGVLLLSLILVALILTTRSARARPVIVILSRD